MSTDSSYGLETAPYATQGLERGPAGRAVLRALPSVIAVWCRRSVSRRHLRDLEAHLLHDVGLSAMQRDREIRKWFWMR